MRSQRPFVAIACGGTGGHLFPGVAVAEELLIKGCSVGLIISSKAIDQQIAGSVFGAEILTISAKGFGGKGKLGALRGFFQSLSECKSYFAKKPPQAVISMGGFTSPPAILAARAHGAVRFLHEANAIPGRANRWLAHFVDEAFVNFHEASSAINHPRIHTVGMPVRNQFSETSAEACRVALGLDPKKPVILVMGGSQGASAVNNLVIDSISALKKSLPTYQYFHLTGEMDAPKVTAAYAAAGLKAIVKPFFTEMELALGAATLAINRAGASSLAELAAMRLPSILIPYPHAADNHQYYNALAFVEAGAAELLIQEGAAPQQLETLIAKCLSPLRHQEMRDALSKLHRPNAALDISEFVMRRLKGVGSSVPSSLQSADQVSPEICNLQHTA